MEEEKFQEQFEVDYEELDRSDVECENVVR